MNKDESHNQAASSLEGAFTRGPWWIEDGHKHHIIYAKDSDGDDTVVAEVHWWVVEGAEESRANARLIAAAPALVEASKEIDRWSLVIDSAVRFADSPSNAAGVSTALHGLRTALRQALGEEK